MLNINVIIRITILNFLIFNILNSISQNVFKEYIINKTIINKVDKYSKENNVEKTLYFADRIINSKELTFRRKTFIILSKLMLKNNEIDKSLLYLDEAVKIGHWWGGIDKDLIKYYNYQRFKKNWEQYEKNYLDYFLINLLSKVSVTDQGVRIKSYKSKKVRDEEFNRVDSINNKILKNYIKNNSWPKFFSYNDTCNSILSENEDTPITSYISHFGRQNLMYFLNEAYISANKGLSSWNQVFHLENFLLWKFPYKEGSVYFSNKIFRVGISPLHRIFVNNKTYQLDIYNSLFEIISIAEIAHPTTNNVVFILPSPYYYKKNKTIAYQNLNNLIKIFKNLKINKLQINFINSKFYNNNFTLINRYCNFNSPYFVVLFQEYKKGTFLKVPYGQPTFFEYSNISEDDINSIYKK